MSLVNKMGQNTVAFIRPRSLGLFDLYMIMKENHASLLR